MFDLDAGDELDLVVETARKFAQEELAPAMRDSEGARSPSDALRATWNEMGLASLEIPEALDGAGLGCLARVLVNEELAAGDVGAALALDPFGPAATALLEVGGDEAAAMLLSATDQGSSRALLVVAEDARIDLGENTVDCEIPWVPAEDAAALVLLAGDGALLVTSGLEFEPVRGAGLRAAGGAALRLAGAECAGRWTNPARVLRARARARLYYASLLLGVMRGACEFSTAYSQQREAFGKPIGHHQALAFMITDMRM
ncbi:MAG: acyl-CoA dehydrogenase, partial [bacterium]|nr:acyl-CoA dehydrogenase [bacterium]